MAAAIVMLPARRGREDEGAFRLRLFPRGRNGYRWLYAVGFRDGRAKLGATRRPRERLLQHWAASDGQVAWVHLFGCFPLTKHPRANDASAIIEAKALRLAALVSTRVRRTETFRGLSRDDAIRCMRMAIAEQRT